MDFKKLEGNNFSFKFFVKIDRKINHQFQIVCLYFIFSTDFRRIKKLLCIGRFFDLIEETKFLLLFRSSVLRVWIFGRDPSAMKVRLCIWQILAVTLTSDIEILASWIFKMQDSFIVIFNKTAMRACDVNVLLDIDFIF